MDVTNEQAGTSANDQPQAQTVMPDNIKNRNINGALFGIIKRCADAKDAHKLPGSGSTMTIEELNAISGDKEFRYLYVSLFKGRKEELIFKIAIAAFQLAKDMGVDMLEYAFAYERYCASETL